MASFTIVAMSKARAKKIKLILFDVDGVLTDGTIWLFPTPQGVEQTSKTSQIAAAARHSGYGISSSTMIEAKGFHAHDGIGISLARLAGLKTGLITKRISETVALRARDLKISHVFQGQADKTQAMEKILEIEKLTECEVAFVGDDLVDLPVMRRCGLAVAVANAREQVKEEAHFITQHRGGEGAARDAVEFILKAQNRLEEIIDQYIASRPAVQKAVPSE
ncbi:MAG: Phosphatase kdsC [Candidatus Angelobacter sp.]|jgi:3-deoxy-D-manno-octulosonate 8-phosphate phosphatase (KDO 8-P phosphatase)|nr:Phosphatase kdsC [Candidatus Angelobacter sp.]